MSIFQGVCVSFKQDILQGTHDIDSDTLKIALYGDSASLSTATTAYTTTGEASGTGYTAGGQTITATVSTSGQRVEVVFGSVTWPSATIEAAGALIYNSSKSNKAILVLNFGGTRSVTAADFTVSFPAAGTDYPVLRLGS